MIGDESNVFEEELIVVVVVDVVVVIDVVVVVDILTATRGNESFRNNNTELFFDVKYILERLINILSVVYSPEDVLPGDANEPNL